MKSPATSLKRRQLPTCGRHGVRAALVGAVLVLFGAAAPVAESQPATGDQDWAIRGNGQETPGVPVVTGARIVRNDELTRFVLDISAPVTPKAFVMADPNRVILDIPEAIFQIDPAIGQSKVGPSGRPAAGRGQARKPGDGVVPEGAIASFRFGRLAPGKSRIVIDLAEPALIMRATSEADADGGNRLILELARSDTAAFNQAAKQSIANLPVQKPTRVEVDSAKSPLESGGLPVVVIDPGHGGIDTGALRYNGTAVEKDLVLEFSRTLAERLRRTGRYKVVMTRDEDVFIPLNERVQIAQAAQAQLFVSVHADTLRYGGGVSGATVYTVSEKASDREAARLAEQENLADKVAGLDGAEATSDVSDILFDLTRRETRAYSHLFARTLVSIWKEAGSLNKNPMRSAGFRVLKAPDVPSVLLELGYLSSDKDAAQMRTPEWREKTADAVTRSIDSFFAPRIKARSASGAELRE
ncbi:N-acetylmuramoyl-L-alanine amidase [Roseiarcaceae bacterium H3SJ34-1]|uniref:N-acetylmuramoyl-L-alanine amidase n=1 Tax=Terripilifer ovatus TaxID=3032367 RepID=UPI003AB9A0BF|nr:N-acetylmuramoyl-L-alanine amidase [Roseiarcaceae bacterium H3SJ34-1]